MQQTLTSGLVGSIVDLCVRHGIPRLQLERAVCENAASASTRNYGDGRLSTQIAHGLMRVVAQHRGSMSVPILGSIECVDFGLPGFMLLTAPTTACALESFARYQCLASHVVGGWLVVQDSDGLLLKCESPQRAGEFEPTWAEAAVTAAVAMLRDVLGAVHTKRVCLRHAAPPHHATLAKFFDCDTHFGADENSVVFSYEAMDRRPRMSNPAMYRYFEQQAAMKLTSWGRQDDLLERVRSKISAGIQNGGTSAADVARQIGMSERTLRRKLEERGHGFRELLDQCRLGLGEQLLSDTALSLTEIALSLGFSETSAFSRAFRRRRGESPRKYLSRLRNKA
jgi:AraC-like DNA-binding protein